VKFSFGENWKSFSATALTPERVSEARRAFSLLTEKIELPGKSFLDVGFGQGLTLFLAAEAGAVVRGIDSDPQCEEAKNQTRRFFPQIKTPATTVASILDEAFVRDQEALGGYDVVHSWGVLHHTGHMHRAFRNTARLVKPGGALVIAVYNRHWTSPLWKVVKVIYNNAPRPFQETLFRVVRTLSRLREPSLRKKGSAVSQRGMAHAHDLRDWLGGYPYEYAGRDQVVEAFSPFGFNLLTFIPSRGWTGCNQFVFRRRKG